jgi:hypothetical protein
MKRVVGAAVFAAVLLAGCARVGLGFRKIGDVLTAPQNYAGKEILIRGTVSNTLKIPFVTIRLYAVRDATGEINVRTDKEPPLAGSQVHVRGVLDTVAVVGDQNVGLHLREIERW